MRAGFHDISGVLMAGALQFHNVAAVCDALAVFWKAMTEYVGHESDIDFFADRAHGL